MKIHQLPMGARFLYEGEEYVKTGPMVGAGKGGQRLIPKSAVLRPLGDAPAAPPEPRSETLQRTAVQEAFDDFYARCILLVPQERRGELELARETFARSLDIG